MSNDKTGNFMPLLSAGYLLFPPEVVYAIIDPLCHRKLVDGLLDPYTTRPQSCCKIDNSVVKLSTTCRYLREIIAPVVFLRVSVVRRSPLDSLLQLPVLLEPPIEPLKNRVLQFSTVNQYVTVLETDDVELLSLFPLVKHLTMLGNSVWNGTVTNNLRSLTISAGTLAHSPGLLGAIELLESLHILCAFFDMDRDSLTQISTHLGHQKLNSLDIYLGVSITFKAVLLFLRDTLTDSASLTHLGLHSVRKSFQQDDRMWPCCTHEEAGVSLLQTVNSSSIESLTVEVGILMQLEIPHLHERKHQTTTLILTDPSFSFHSWHLLHYEKISRLFLGLNVQEFHWKYGEVIDDAHIQALDAMTQTLNKIYTTYGCKIDTIQLEKSWSVSDDTLVRDYLQSQAKHAFPTMAKRYSFNSPRYRRPECFQVLYGATASVHQAIKSHQNDTDESFWALQNILLDMQQYCLPPRQKSRLWD